MVNVNVLGVTKIETRSKSVVPFTWHALKGLPSRHGCEQHRRRTGQVVPLCPGQGLAMLQRDIDDAKIPEMAERHDGQGDTSSKRQPGGQSQLLQVRNAS